MCLMCAKICHLSCMSYSLLVRNTWDIHINIGNSIVHDDKEIMMRSPNFEAGPCMRNGEWGGWIKLCYSKTNHQLSSKSSLIKEVVFDAQGPNLDNLVTWFRIMQGDLDDMVIQRANSKGTPVSYELNTHKPAPTNALSEAGTMSAKYVLRKQGKGKENQCLRTQRDRLQAEQCDRLTIDQGSPNESFFRRGVRTNLPNSIAREVDHRALKNKWKYGKQAGA